MAESGRKSQLEMGGFALFAVGLVILCVSLMGFGGGIRSVCILLLILLSAGAVGGLLGFLFGIPRVLVQGQAGNRQDNPDGKTAPGDGRRLASNTNLERISDWLTTMLVGVGLSQVTKVSGYLMGFGEFLKTMPGALPCKAGPCDEMGQFIPTLGPMILVVGIISGFIAFYIYTRLTLVVEFNYIEQTLSGDARTEVKNLAVQLSQASENPNVKGLVSGVAPTVDEALNIMLQALYVKDGGYQKVIDLSAYLANSPATKRAEYWYYLAAAFGQKYTALKKQKDVKDKDVQLDSTFDNAMDCAARAVEIDPIFRERLWDISTPGAFDDDLAPFRDEPRFQRITGHLGR